MNVDFSVNTDDELELLASEDDVDIDKSVQNKSEDMEVDESLKVRLHVFGYISLKAIQSIRCPFWLLRSNKFRF